ncbi:transcription repressor OFP15-like isoform X2 [Andrographis paniculata]|nr:transcription repressor OFP15-like isoform X2 [Andrographis paniculata]XP_051131792.1 transcription repressor OFP15-like isoform X2 [Andrographis paniculata]
MGSKKKMKKLPFLCQASETTWPWPTCVNDPATHSFRGDNIISGSRNAAADDQLAETSASSNLQDEMAVIGGVMSERLFFEPEKTNSILEEGNKGQDEFAGAVALVEMESMEPVLDFRTSMEEMVEAYCGLKDWDWECLEELLACYLKVNGRHNHHYIVGAFVELLLLHLDVAVAKNGGASAIDDEHCPCESSSSSTVHCSFTCSSSTYSSTTPYCLSALEIEDDDDEEDLE